MKIKSIISSVLAATLALSLVSCGNQTTQVDSNNVVLGTMGPLSGENAVYGVSTINGLNLAIEERQSVLDKPIKLISIDDKAEQTEAVNAYNKLVDNDGAVAILGAVTSQSALSVAVTSSKYGTPILTPTGTAPNITEAGDNVFRACYTDSFQGEIMAKFAFENLGLTKVAIMENTDLSYSAGLTESFKSEFTSLGGEVVSNEGYASSDKDFKAQLIKVAASKPEALFIPDYYSNVYLIANQAKDIGLTDITLLGGDGWDGMHTLFEKDENGQVKDASILEGAYFCSHYSLEDESPVVQNFVEKYRAKYGEDPNAFAALGYDSANIMIDAIERAGSTESSAIINELKNTSHSGVTGEIKFDSQGDTIKSVSIIKMENGSYTLYDKIGQ